jgi:phospholipid/cholesterol/gamma-HCH transport system ATP-binding protein
VLRIAENVAFLHDQKLSWYGTRDEMRESNHQDLLNFIRASEYQI